MEEKPVDELRRSHRKGTDAILLAFVGCGLSYVTVWVGVPVLIIALVLFAASMVRENRATSQADAQTREFLQRQEIRRTGFVPALVRKPVARTGSGEGNF